jgi:hypothetical protein
MVEDVNHFLDNGADISATDEKGYTALHYAAESGFQNVIKTLLHRGADINAKSDDFRTPLHLAAAIPFVESLVLLLSRGANVNAQDIHAQPSLYYATSAGITENVIALLLNGANAAICKGWNWVQTGARPISDWWKESEYGRVVVCLSSEILKHLKPSVDERDFPVGLDFSSSTRTLIESLRESVILTGSGDSVECDTAEDFLQKTWGDAGILALTYLCQAISGALSYLPSETRRATLQDQPPLDVDFSYSAFDSKNVNSLDERTTLLELAGNLKNSQAIADAMTWICSALRPGKPQGASRYFIQDSTMSCEAYFTAKYGLTTLQFGDFKLGDLKDSQSLVNWPATACWGNLFQSGVIAQRSLKRSWGLGLEVPFDIMIHLAAVENCYRLDSGTIFLGFFTALVPIAINHETNSIQWHFEFVDDTADNHIDPRQLKSIQHGWFKTTEVGLLRHARCFLGWSEAANILLGTRQLLEHHQLRHSIGTGERLKTAHREGFEAGAQIGFSIGPMNLGSKGTHSWSFRSNVQRFNPSNQYIQGIRLSSRKVALIIDSQSKQSWLVPLLSLIFHLCHRYIQEFSTGTGINPLPFVTPSPNGSEAVLAAIDDKGDIIVFGQSGSDHETLRQLIMRINRNLLDTAYTVERPDRNFIYASEIMDVITEPSRGSPLRTVAVSQSTRSWQLLIEKVDVVGVCSNVGHVIQPIGPASKIGLCKCYVLPENRDLLAAHLWCLDELARRSGPGLRDNHSSPCNLGSNIIWQPRATWVTCNDHQHVPLWDDPSKEQNILQKILRQDLKTNHKTQGSNVATPMNETGVVVFGDLPSSNKFNTKAKRLRDFFGN